MPIHYIAPHHSDLLSPLPLQPVDTLASTSYFRSLATCVAAPILLHSNPIPLASQPPLLLTCTYIHTLTTAVPMAHGSHVSGPATMPHPHSNATPFFSGTLDDPINNFLAEYSELADGHRLSK